MSIRKCISAKGGDWSEWLSDILWAMRVLTSRSHGHSPYRLVFKMEPCWAEHLVRLAQPPTDDLIDVSAKTEAEVAEALE